MFKSVVRAAAQFSATKQGARSYASVPGKPRRGRYIFGFAGGVVVGITASVVAYKSSLPESTVSRSLFSVAALPLRPSFGDRDDINAAIDEIEKVVGKTNVNESKDMIRQHADSDWQSRHPKTSEVPTAVVMPASTEEVSQIMKICNKYHVPVVPYSGGTSLEGHYTPVYGGISLDMSRMGRILKLHAEDLDVVVQPAVGWEDLDDYLKDYKLMFGPDPGPGAQIGGMIGTSCSGTNAYRYLTMRQNVVSLTVVLADGTIIKTKRRPRKSSAGYALNELFVGAEGTLGIVTEATLKLAPRPNVRRVGLMTFDKISDATDTVQAVLLAGLNLDAMELMDEGQMRILNESGITERRWNEKETLLLRFAGATADAVENEISAVKKLAEPHNLLDLAFASSEEESEDLWSARKMALASVVGAAPEGHKVWTTDVAVPISKLSQMVADSRTDIANSGVGGSILGHVGDGNFHAILTYDPQTQKEIAEGLAHRIVLRALDLDGTCTGEHGIGVGKRRYLVEEVGEDTVATMRQIKRALDPNFILNPGKIFSIAQFDVSDH